MTWGWGEAMWRDRITLGEQLRRKGRVLEAQKHVAVYDGQPVRFTEEEATRLAFLEWRIQQADLEQTKGDA